MRSGKAKAAPGKLAPGRIATPEEVKRWKAEIVAFLRLVQENQLNVHGAAKIALSLRLFQVLVLLPWPTIRR